MFSCIFCCGQPVIFCTFKTGKACQIIIQYFPRFLVSWIVIIVSVTLKILLILCAKKYLSTFNKNSVTKNPLNVKLRSRSSETLVTPSSNMSFLKESGLTASCKRTLINDATQIWNKAREIIKMCKSVNMAKKAIKTFVKTLPI